MDRGILRFVEMLEIMRNNNIKNIKKTKEEINTTRIMKTRKFIY